MSIDAKLDKAFHSFSLTFTQKQMQQYLEQVEAEEGFPAVLEHLNEWSFGSGYLTPEKLSDNKHYEYKDKATGVTFKTQINIARSNYTPASPSGKKVPKLHCPICFENIGIPGKENLRAFSFDIAKGRRFFIQQTPFPLFPYHFVLIDHEKTPMQVTRQSAIDLTNFVELAPEFVACSNSDVEWAGASILRHHHYQVFKDLHLPVMEADWRDDAYERTNSCGYTTKWGFLNYPIATIKIRVRDKDALIKLADRVIRHWKSHEVNNTCNLIIRKLEREWEAYFILRNPQFRTPKALQAIKSEGVGIIEVAGEGIYPVPSGEKADWAWDQIEKHGLDVILGIIQGANPIAPDDLPEAFADFKTVIDELSCHWG